MPFFRPINLPAPLILQSVTSVGLGLYIAFFRKPPFVHNGYTALIPSNAPPRTADVISLLGLVIAGLESLYLVASYMPIEENQFIAASIPVRLALAISMGGICVVHKNTMSKSGFWELVGLGVLDGGAAVVLGIWLRRWDGMVQGA
jgi:hypothetical protein